jgi:hypothetical protein
MPIYRAGNTGTISAGTNSATLGQVVFSNSNNISFGMNNSSQVTASYDPARVNNFIIRQGSLAAASYGNSVFFVQPCDMPPGTFDRALHFVNVTNTTNVTGTLTISFFHGLYTRNNNTLSLATSGSQSLAITFSGSERNSLNTGIRHFSIPLSANITGGAYWYAAGSVTATAGANATVNQLVVSQFNSSFIGPLGVPSNQSYQKAIGYGSWSANTNNVPSSMAFSDLRGSGLWARDQYVVFVNGTV